MKQKKDINYLELVPLKNPEIQYETDDQGLVTVRILWKGFYHRIAQRFFHRPKSSDIQLDDYGSFVWMTIDGKKDVEAISSLLQEQFPDMEKPLPRLIQFLEILKNSSLIQWDAHQ